MIIVFCISVFAVVYAYVGYPLLLYILASYKEHPIHRDSDYLPTLSFVITVHNEQHRLHSKIENTLALDYPQERLQIIFASDASTDDTEIIILSNPSFFLVRSNERRGKEYAQKLAVDQANGEILVFSDVATMLDPQGLKTIVANFADPSVGCVSSEDRFIDEQGRESSEGIYVRYEMFLRRLESRVHSLVGMSGSFFAARRQVCMNWAVDLQSDFNTLLNARKLDYRGISDPNSLGYYRDIADQKKEFSRKVRTVLRGMTVVRRNLEMLDPFRYGIFSWSLFSHKFCRWCVPLFLILLLISNLFLLPENYVYSLLFAAQAIFYSLAALHPYQKHKHQEGKSQEMSLRLKWLKKLIHLRVVPYYFVIVNAAILMAWIKLLRGETAIYWEPSQR